MATPSVRLNNAAKRPATRVRARVRRGNVMDAERLRRELCDAAMALFRQGGLEAITMRAIGESVGVSVMTPYRYFSDKSALLSALWQHVIAELHMAIAAAVENKTGATVRYRAAVDAYFGYYQDHPDEFWLAYETQYGASADECPPSERVAVYVDLLALMRQLTLDVAGEHGASAAHVDEASRLALVMQLGLLQATMVNRRYPWGDLERLRAATTEQVVQLVVRVLLHGALPRGE